MNLLNSLIRLVNVLHADWSLLTATPAKRPILLRGLIVVYLIITFPSSTSTPRLPPARQRSDRNRLFQALRQRCSERRF